MALALTANRQIKAALGISNSAVDAVIRPVIQAPAYLALIAAGGNRFNLDGTVAGRISEAHRRHAADRLRAMSKFRP